MSSHPNNPNRLYTHPKVKWRFQMEALLALPTLTPKQWETVKRLRSLLGVGRVTNPEGKNQWAKKPVDTAGG